MGTEIELKVNGILVVGKICHRTSRDIVVEITEPFQGISKGLHIPYFGAKYRSYDGTHGSETAKNLLKQIYTICCETRNSAPKLVELLELWDILKNEYQDRTISNRELKRNMRKDFKGGIISQTQYQSSLRAMDRELTSCHIRLSGLFRERIQPFFTDVIPVCSRQMVIDFAKKNMG